MINNTAIYFDVNQPLNLKKVENAVKNAYGLSRHVNLVTINTSQQDLKQLKSVGAENVYNIKNTSFLNNDLFTQKALVKFIAAEKVDLLLLGNKVNNEILQYLGGKYDGSVNKLLNLEGYQQNIIIYESIYHGQIVRKREVMPNQALIFAIPVNFEKKVISSSSNSYKQSSIEELNYHFDLHNQLISSKEKEDQKQKITDSSVVIAVGRGAAQEDDLEMVNQLAKGLKAAIGHTRGFEDANSNFEASNLIGTSGKKIQPDVLLNLGISGAVHYINGIDKSKTVISINKNPQAKIFNYSDYKIVGNVQDILKSLIKLS